MTPTQVKAAISRHPWLKSASFLKDAGVNYSSFQKWQRGDNSVHYWKYFEKYSEIVERHLQAMNDTRTTGQEIFTHVSV